MFVKFLVAEAWRATLVWGDDSGWSGGDDSGWWRPGGLRWSGGDDSGWWRLGGLCWSGVMTLTGLGAIIQTGGGLEGYAGLG